MKILYISFHFAPYNHIAAIRSTKLCKYLHRMGEDLRVVSASNQPLPSSLPIEIPKEKIIYSDWKNVNTPFKFLFSNQKEVEANRSYLTQKQKENLFVKRIVHLYKSVLYFPDDKIGWIWPAYKNIKELFKSWTPDLIYVSGGPFSSFILGSLLHKKYKIPWVAEYRDLWTQGHQYPFGILRKTIEKYFENRAVFSAEGFVTVSKPLANRLEARFNKNVSVITNAFDPEDRKEFLNSSAVFEDSKLNIVYTGQIYIDRQDLSPLFNALQKDGELREKVDVHFYGPNLKEKIGNKFSKELLEKISPNLIFHGLVDHEHALRAQQAADILLLLGWTDEDFGGVLTGKLFEYLGAKKYILALNNYLDDASGLVVEHDVGFFCKNHYEVSGTLKKLLKMKSHKEKIEPSMFGIEQFSYDVKAFKLSEVLKDLIS